MHDYRKPGGMVALNPRGGSHWWKNPRDLIKELLDGGCTAFMIQRALPGFRPNELVKVIRQLERSDRRTLLVNHRNNWEERGSLYGLIHEDLDAGYDAVTVVATEDTFPELEAIAARSPLLLGHLIGICVLTTQDDGTTLKYHGASRNQLLLRRVNVSHAIGLRNLFCGIPDVPVIRSELPGCDFHMLFTPGTRRIGESPDDHKVTGTPAEARKYGACWVVGRNVASARSPRAAYEACVRDTL